MQAAKSSTHTSLNILKLLLEYRASIHAINAGDESVLTIAALHNNIPALCRLIYAGVRIDQKNSIGLTTLDTLREIQDNLESDSDDDFSFFSAPIDSSVGEENNHQALLDTLYYSDDDGEVSNMSGIPTGDQTISLVSKGEASPVYQDYFKSVIKPEVIKEFAKKEGVLNRLINREIGR
jgi:hypothetical protein